MRSKILSLIIAVIYLVIAGLAGGIGAIIRVCIMLVLPLGCIWFGTAMGGYTGTMRLHPITSSSPGWLVRIVGWILLLLPVIVLIIYLIRGIK
jgi:hypothetical protein